VARGDPRFLQFGQWDTPVAADDGIDVETAAGGFRSRMLRCEGEDVVAQGGGR